ncbi:MAG TPA: GntR family transcriptional regulator [Thermodesulfobacteriota bacterium]|nr:GntR family transcriptional regulator [Thermodesulfobacteriota bacterium]
MPLALKAYNLLKEKIITLEFGPGEPLDEKRIANGFGFGRTPLREAILRLEADNLVDIFPGKGTYVKQITLKGVRDLLQALLALERATIQLSLLNITPAQIDEIRSVHEQIIEAIRKSDSINITYFNNQFHRLIAKASNNEYLSTYIQKIRVEEQRLAYLCFSKEVSATYPLKEHFRQVIEEHSNIITYLEKKDAQRLDEEIVNHNRLFQRRIFGYLESYLAGETGTGQASRKRSSH